MADAKVHTPHNFEDRKVTVSEAQRDAVLKMVNKLPRGKRWSYATFVAKLDEQLKQHGHNLSFSQIGFALDSLERSNRLRRSDYVESSDKHYAGVA